MTHDGGPEDPLSPASAWHVHTTAAREQAQALLGELTRLPAWGRLCTAAMEFLAATDPFFPPADGDGRDDWVESQAWSFLAAQITVRQEELA